MLFNCCKCGFVHKHKHQIRFFLEKVAVFRNSNLETPVTYGYGSIVLDGLIIPVVTSTNYLGVLIDSKLNFSNHLEHINSKAAQLSGIK